MVAKLKEDMERVHENTDFKVNFAGVTQMGEFRYTHGGSVQPGLEYHIHYTNDKKEVYMTGGIHNSSSKIIERIGSQSSFQRYTRLKQSSKSQYPRKHTPLPNDSDYNIGEISRYFCQKSNDKDSELFEVSIDNYDKQNNLFRYFEITWRISGKKSEVIRDNQSLIDSISIIRGNEQLRKILFPLQYWNPPKDSVDDIQAKLNRRKIM